MSIKLRVILLIALALYFLLLWLVLRRRRMNLKYTLLWILSGFVMLLFAVFPSLLDALSKFVGIAVPTTALFAVLIFCIIVILMSITAIVSMLNDKVKTLVQTNALLEERVRQLENQKE